MIDVSFIIFKSLNSYSDFNLFIERFTNIPIPKRNIDEIYVPGRNGILTYDNKTYNEIKIPVTFGVEYTSLQDLILIKSWLNGTGGNLVLSGSQEYFFCVKKVIVDDIEEQVNTLGLFTAVFICNPFMYGSEIIRTITTNNFSFTYNGTIEAEPIIKVYGSGNITLTLNSKNIILTGVNSYITIDSKLKDCYKDTALTNSQMSGEFPLIKPGTNTISWIGTVSKIEVTYNETYL